MGTKPSGWQRRQSRHGRHSEFGWTASQWRSDSWRWVLHHDPREARLCHRWVVDSRGCCGTSRSHRAARDRICQSWRRHHPNFYLLGARRCSSQRLQVHEINQAACNTAKKVAREWGTIVAGGITQTGTFNLGSSVKSKVQNELRKALEVLILNKVDLIICEYFRNILEMEWAIEVALEYGIPVAATMCIGPGGDESGVGAGECAVRMAKAGALLVGVNCLFDPFICLEVLKTMKVALDAFELSPYLMAQPLGYRVPDGGSFGWVEIPEFPFSVEPRQITRWEARRWARQAYELGVRFIGGCCGFEPYHIRAMAEELADVRGGLPEASSKSDHDLAIHRSLEEKGLKRYKNKGCLDYWMDHQPATGRPLSTAVCCPLAEPAVMHPGVFS